MAKVIRKQNPEVMKRLKLALRELDGNQLKVGWFETAKYEDGTPVAYVASIQEYGATSKSIPPRPFFRPTIAKQKVGWGVLAESASKAILAGNETGTSALEKMGLQVTGDVAATIESITSPALSPITLALRKLKRENPDLKVGGKMIGQVAAQLAAGEIDISGVNADPLKDSGLMIATLTHGVDKK